MNFPHTNKLNDGVPNPVESSAELLESMAKTTDFKYLLKIYFCMLGVLLITLFSIITTIRLAISLF